MVLKKENCLQKPIEYYEMKNLETMVMYYKK